MLYISIIALYYICFTSNVVKKEYTNDKKQKYELVVEFDYAELRNDLRHELNCNFEARTRDFAFT